MTTIRKIEGYTLEEWLGDGAYGPIYRGRQESLDRPVVVKLLDEERAGEPEARAAFLDLARPLARVVHTNLVCVLDVADPGATDAPAWFVMEAAGGRTIEDHLKGSRTTGAGALPERQSLRVVSKVARGLHALHSKLVLHRRVRPRSILITQDGVPKLTDIGIAGLESARDLADAGHARTAWYTSPEQARGDTDGDVASDVYALGATLFHMLSGRPPFDGETPDEVLSKHATAAPPKAGALRHGISAGTEAILARCLAKRPADRFMNADALAQEIDDLVRAAGPARPARPSNTNTAPSAAADDAPLLVRRRKHRRRRRY